MSSPKDRPAAHFEVDDPKAAFQKLQAFARRILAVPKREVDTRAAAVRVRSAKKRKH